MITEKMLELILLRDIIREYDIRKGDTEAYIAPSTSINASAIMDRQEQLFLEFINPYVVDEA